MSNVMVIQDYNWSVSAGGWLDQGQLSSQQGPAWARCRGLVSVRHVLLLGEFMQSADTRCEKLL